MDTPVLGKVVAFLCSVPPNTALRLMLQLALAALISEDGDAINLFIRLSVQVY